MTVCSIVDRDGVVQARCELDDLFSVLANDRRREIITTLEATTTDWIERDHLRSIVTDACDLDAEQFRREFHHVHRPKLEDLGLIEYDHHSETIRCYQCPVLTELLDVLDRQFSDGERPRRSRNSRNSHDSRNPHDY